MAKVMALQGSWEQAAAQLAELAALDADFLPALLERIQALVAMQAWDQVTSNDLSPCASQVQQWPLERLMLLAILS